MDWGIYHAKDDKKKRIPKKWEFFLSLMVIE